MPKVCLPLLVATAVLATIASAATESSSAPTPIVIEGAPKIDLTQADGGLPPVPGAQNFGVFRASHVSPELADGRGYTYNHHPDLAVWHGRFYVAWDSGAKDEDAWPARELYSTSENGRDWSAPAELFPEGVAAPARLYFFHAPNGRMLAFAALRIGHEKTDEDTKGPMVVREIRADHSLSAVHVLRPAAAGANSNLPLYSDSSDAGFVDACRQLLAARVALETQDLGVFLPTAERISWHDAAKWPAGKVGNGFWKAPSFYHRKDGAIVGVGKAGWVSVSHDDGTTWSQPVVPPTLVTNNAKVWGQRTGDGRYALVYNPTSRPRYPLALVTGDDGVSFGNMRAVQPTFPPQRYPGINKNTGLQYIRGIAEWASDGSIPDAAKALWIVYSSNKEDIWLSRIALPVRAVADPNLWNIYQPKWATVATSGPNSVTIESREPFDQAEAVKLFAARSKVSVSFKLTAPARGDGAVDVELLGGSGGARPVRLRFAGDGFLRALDRDKMVEFGEFSPGATIALSIDAQCGGRGLFAISIDGKKVGQAQFAEAATALERLALRVWSRADADRGPVFLPATASVGAEFDRPAAAISTRITDLAIH